MQAIEPETLKRAFEAITRVELAPNGHVTSEVTGYISSFGAAIIQAGLEAAVIFFSEASSDGDAADRPKIIEALRQMMGINEGTMIDFLRAESHDLDDIEERLLDNAVALKLALRSFGRVKTLPANPQNP